MKKLTKKELTLKRLSITELDNKGLLQVIGGTGFTATNTDDRELSSLFCGSSVTLN